MFPTAASTLPLPLPPLHPLSLSNPLDPPVASVFMEIDADVKHLIL